MKLVECVPNFSEGRDLKKVEQIADCFRGKKGVRLLDWSADADHNRSVITAAGEPEALAAAVVEAVGRAKDLIDLRRHSGQHPRIGAADVIPFVPLRGVTEAETVALSERVGQEIGDRYGIPVYLYEQSARHPGRRNLADVRRGGFEGLARKMQDPAWKPDFGPDRPHPSFGAVAVGCRKLLCAFNVNLNTGDLGVARAVARKVRERDGGLPFCKALGLELKERGLVQVSMNLTDFTQTSVWAAFEAVKAEAGKLGVTVAGSELIGLFPAAALLDAAAHYLQIENYAPDRVLEARLFE